MLVKIFILQVKSQTFMVFVALQATSILSESIQVIQMEKTRGRWLRHNFSSSLK